LKKRINRYSAETASALPYGLFAAACAAIIWVVAGDVLAGSLAAFVPQADYWEFVAVLREWLQNPASPGNPLVDDPALSARFMPWFWLLTMTGQVFVLNPEQLLGIGAVVALLTILAGMFLFSREYFRNPWAPFISLLVLFTFWGSSGHWPGIYQLRNFVYIAAYPSTLVFGLSLVSFWVTMRLLQSDRALPLWAAGLAVLTTIMFLTHPITGLFGVTGCILLALTESTNSLIKRLTALLVIVAGLALTELWPYFSVWKFVLGLYGPGLEDLVGLRVLDGFHIGMGMVEAAAPLYEPMVIVGSLGLSLLGLPIVIYLLKKSRRPFIVYGAFLMLLPYVLNIIVDMPTAHNYLFFAAIYFQFAIVWGWLRLIGSWQSIPRPVFAVPGMLFSVVAGAGLVIANITLLNLEYEGRELSFASMSVEAVHASAEEGNRVPQIYGSLLAPVANDAIVLAMPDTGWPVAAVKGRVVANSRDNSMLADQQERLQAAREFFLWPAEDLDRVATIQQYSVSHVLIDTSDSELHEDVGPWLDSYSQLVSEQGSLKIYQLAEALHQVKLPEPEAPAMVEAAFTVETTTAKATKDDTDSELVVSDPRRESHSAEPQDDSRSFGAPIAKPLFEAEPSGS